MEKIKIKYLSDITPIEQKEGSDWVDLRCAKDVKIFPGEVFLIPLGIAMELPKGYEAHVVPRSSTCKRYNLLQANSIGIIDNSYSGDKDEWMLPVVNVGSYPVVVEKDTRICQFRLQKKQPAFEFVEVETLGNGNRGGFGSTGVK